jgi:DNA-binding NarL/FixJ family response regulator
MLLRMQIGGDPRFEVVGEASDGYEAIELAGTHHPDIIVLDKQMPGLDGVDAMPEIRRRSPESAIVLYTAQIDPATYHAALDAGALQVLDKLGAVRGFTDQLVAALLRGAASGEPGIEIHVGPVASSAALVWVGNTRKILDAVVAHPEEMGRARKRRRRAAHRGLLVRHRCSE